MTGFLAAATLNSLQEYCQEHQIPAFRAKQIDSWLHTHCVIDPDEMKNLPADLKSALKNDFFAPGSKISGASKSPDQVEKLFGADPVFFFGGGNSHRHLSLPHCTADL